MSTSLKNQRVLVVGASSGIGRETARLFALEEARVVAAARRIDRLEGLQKELAAEGRQLDFAQADASKPEDMERLAAETLKKFGGLDVLIYAAGTNTPDRSLTRLNPGIWDSLMQVVSGAASTTSHRPSCLTCEMPNSVI